MRSKLDMPTEWIYYTSQRVLIFLRALRLSIHSRSLQPLREGLRSRQWKDAQPEQLGAAITQHDVIDKLSQSLRTQRARPVQLTLNI